MITHRSKQSPCAASTAAGPAHSVLVNASTNRISSARFSYDPNGNLTAMPQTGGGTLHLTYDLSNRVTNLSHNGWIEDYLYSSDNRRIWRSAGRIASSTHIDDEQNLFWFPAANEIGPHYILYTPSGQKLGVYSVRFSPNGQYNVWTASEENVYWGSRLVAKRIGVGPMGHFITDRLHSKGDGSAFYPYGESKTGAPGDDREQFAIYTRDQSSCLDYADQRWYSSRLGRFTSVDAAAVGTNYYAYVDGNPVGAIDPNGLEPYTFYATGTAMAPNAPDVMCIIHPGGPYPMSGWGNGGWDLFQERCRRYTQGPNEYFATRDQEGAGGGGGRTDSDPEVLLEESKKRLIDRLDDDCAEAIGARDSAVAIQRLQSTKIEFRYLGPLEINSGKVRGVVAMANPVLGFRSIKLNTAVNWKDPSTTSATIIGSVGIFDLLAANAYALRVAAISAQQYMDLTILHELAHTFGVHDQDNDERFIWLNCFKF